MMNFSTTAYVESWIVPLDILMIIIIASTLILSGIFLIIIIVDKACHTVLMMFVADTCLVQFLYGSNMLVTTALALQNDLQHTQSHDLLCVARGYYSYVSYFVMFYCFLLQAVYRYVSVLYPTRLFFQSARFQLILICIKWILGFLCSSVFLFMKEIVYLENNQMCVILLRLCPAIAYFSNVYYMIPVSVVMFVYLKLVRYLKMMNTRVTTANAKLRAQREVKMIRQILILITLFVVIGAPVVLLLIVSFFRDLPEYYGRIVVNSANLAMFIVLLVTFRFTEPLQSSVRKALHIRSNVVGIGKV